MNNDIVSKELQYQELIADVQKAYLSESRELRWCKECKEINLWAYWQGRGHLDADIMLVGQDWGCPWDTPSVATMKNVCDMNCGKVVSYMRRNDSITDKNLIQLFRTIGFDILSDDPKLFFTNLVMGYRLQGTSGGFKTAWANADAPFFRRLVDIIHLCKDVQIKEERISSIEYIEFLKRTDLGSQYPKERFEERIAKLVDHVSISLVARNRDNQIVGVLFGLTDYAYWLYVTDLGVDRDYLHQGIGTELMETAHSLAGGKNDIAVYLVANENAISFYKKLGMRRADDVMEYNHIEWTEFTVK